MGSVYKLNNKMTVTKWDPEDPTWTYLLVPLGLGLTAGSVYCIVTSKSKNFHTKYLQFVPLAQGVTFLMMFITTGLIVERGGLPAGINYGWWYLERMITGLTYVNSMYISALIMAGWWDKRNEISSCTDCVRVFLGALGFLYSATIIVISMVGIFRWWLADNSDY